MGAPEMYPELFQDHLTGDPAYDKAFRALADCPSFAQVEAALKAYAHELAEKIRDELPETVKESLGGGIWTITTVPTARQAADLIDPEVTE